MEERRQIPGEQVDVDEVGTFYLFIDFWVRMCCMCKSVMNRFLTAAKVLRKYVVIKLRGRRLKDLFESINGIIGDKPAVEHAEIMEKLNENSKLAEQVKEKLLY